MRTSHVHSAMPLFVASLALALGCSERMSFRPDSITAPPPPVVTPPPVPAGNSTPGEPELPRLLLDTRMAATPSTGRTLRVAAGGNLQAALDTARLGDQVLLAAGATYTGNFVLPATSAGIAGNWITVRTDGQLPSEGTRMTPAQAVTLTLPRIQSANDVPAIRTAGGAARWRISGIEVTVASVVQRTFNLISLGDGGSAQATMASVPTNLIFDRVYVHGQPGLDVRRCFAFNSARTAVIDSYVSECHSAAFDAQAIAGWNGPGPFKIVNNYLEGAAENIAFGGADPSIAQLVPSDIEIRRNHFTKPLSWKGRWLTKNLLELKAGRRVLIEANVMENSWPDGQAGFAMVLWSSNPDGNCPWCITEDVTIRQNLIRNVSSGFQLSARAARQESAMQRVAIRDNVVIGLNAASTPGYGRIFQIADAIPNLIIEHNTAFSPTNSSFVWTGATLLPGHIVRNNLVGGGDYQIFTSAGMGQAAWDAVAGVGSTFTGNVVALAPQNTSPVNNLYPASLDAVGLVGGGRAALSVSAALSELALSTASTFRGRATDGRDPGADVSVIANVTSNVVIP